MQIVAADPKTQQGMLLGIDLDEGDVLVSRTSAVAVYQVEINRQMEKIIELTNKQKNVLITWSNLYVIFFSCCLSPLSHPCNIYISLPPSLFRIKPGMFISAFVLLFQFVK